MEISKPTSVGLSVALLVGGASCSYVGYKEWNHARKTNDKVKAVAIALIGVSAAVGGVICLLSTFLKGSSTKEIPFSSEQIPFSNSLKTIEESIKHSTTATDACKTIFENGIQKNQMDVRSADRDLSDFIPTMKETDYSNLEGRYSDSLLYCDAYMTSTGKEMFKKILHLSKHFRAHTQVGNAYTKINIVNK